jgi:hypothetical protein
MNCYSALIDACVLGGALKRNIILSLAEAGLFRPRWSDRILDETEKAIAQISKGTSNTTRQRAAIEHAFPEALVLPADPSVNVSGITHVGDEHVSQSALAARCETALGWRSSISLREGIAATYRWYLDNRADLRG